MAPVRGLISQVAGPGGIVMSRRFVGLILGAGVLSAVVLSGPVMLPTLAADEAKDDPKGIDFFEKKIRPVLVANCYQCHSASAKELKGELRLDTRAGIRKGGEQGKAVVPGNVRESLIITALKHEDGLEMPPKEKLSDAIVADFTKWVEMGAPDPRRP